MDWVLKDGSSRAISEEETADSDLWSSDAALSSRGSDDGMEEDNDDDDAESCNCDTPGVHRRGAYDSGGDGDGDGDEEVSGDLPPVSRRASMMQNAAAWGAVEEEVGPGEEEEVTTEKPAAGLEDRLFWEACLAHGYP